MATEISTTSDIPQAGSTSPQQDVSEQVSSRHSKRLSLNFPILPPSGIQSGRGSPSPRTPAADPFSQVLKIPTTSTGFLTALAAQERRVLELREELQRAEGELSTLKKQWAAHEAQKKRSGVQDADLQAVRPEVSKADRDLVEESMGRLLVTRELESQTISKEGMKPRPRKVFSGSRSTRTLSLLSPNATNIRSSFPHPDEPQNSPDNNDGGTPQDPKPSFSRSSTLSETQPQPQQPQPPSLQDILPKRRSMPPPSRDALLRTSKQMASDFREGLWTFFEDLRQATVGDEGINGTETRLMTSTSTSTKFKSPRPRQHKPKPSTRVDTLLDNSLRVTGSVTKASSILGSDSTPQSSLVDVSNDFWKEYGVNNKPSSPQRPQAQLKSDDYDNWDVWDSPLPQKTAKDVSPAPSDGTFSTQRDSPYTSASSPPTASPKSASSSSQRRFSRPKSNLSPTKDAKAAEERVSSSPIPASYDNALQCALNG
jgi:hypothetical protein